MKYEYKIETSVGLVTRKSNSIYSHIVIGKGLTEAAIRAWFAISSPEKIEQHLATRHKSRSDASFCSRQDLAEKMASKLRNEGWEDVLIIKILSENVREIAPRKKP
jgi:hypothetical protein